MISNQDISNRIYKETHNYDIVLSEIKDNISYVIKWVFITLNDWDALHIVDYLPFLQKKYEEAGESFPKEFFWGEMQKYKNENLLFYTFFLHQLIAKNHRSGEAPKPLPFSNEELLNKAIDNLKYNIKETPKDYYLIDHAYTTCWSKRERDSSIIIDKQACQIFKEYITEHPKGFLENIFRHYPMFAPPKATLFPFLLQVFNSEEEVIYFLNNIYKSELGRLTPTEKTMLALARIYLQEFKPDAREGFELKKEHIHLFYNQENNTLIKEPLAEGNELDKLFAAAGFKKNEDTDPEISSGSEDGSTKEVD